jgi:hypothetical protein
VAELHLDTNALIAVADSTLALFRVIGQRIEAGDLPVASAGQPFVTTFEVLV